MSRDPDQSVWREPNLLPVGASPTCKRCGYDLHGLLPTPGADAAGEAGPTDVCPECGRNIRKAPSHPSAASDVLDDIPRGPDPSLSRAAREAAVADNSAWDEPHLAGVADRPAGAASYADTLARRIAATSPATTWLVTALAALAAGPWAVFGAFIAELLGAWGGIGLVVVGPIMEEVMKVAAAAVIIETRPHLFRSRVQVLLCAAAGGLAFGVIENLMYLHVYVPDASDALASWRWSVCTALHVGCSIIAGLGLARAWRSGMLERRRPDLSDAFPLLIAAVAIHGAYNAAAMLLSLTGYAF